MKNEEKMTIEEARIELANNVYAFKREFEKSVSQVLVGFKKAICFSIKNQSNLKK